MFFPYRSAEYFYNKGICRLSRETRRSQPYAFQHYGDGVEYLENQCHSGKHRRNISNNILNLKYLILI